MVSELRTHITHALGSEVDFSIEHPADLAYGDYATNAAMVVAKELGKNPREVAEELVEKLSIPGVARIEIAGPGFINFYLERDFFSGEVQKSLERNESWGTNELWKGKKVVVEYTDPNPFKEFHIGHVFTNAVGESIARLFIAAGAETKRVNYQGDVGMHVAKALWGMQQLGFTAEKSCTARELGKAYALGATAYTEQEEAKEAIKTLNAKVYKRSDEAVNALYDAGRKVSLEYFEEMYALLGTQFDEYFFESEAAPLGKELVLAHPDIFIESDGARVFEGEKHGLHTRVFLNSEGLPTYEAKELALAELKNKKLGGYDHSVISTSNEITEYFKVLKKAMSFVYPELAEKTEHIGHGTVRLPEGKMSSRTGDVIAGIDFINEVAERAQEKMGEGADQTLARHIAIGAIKYAILRGSIFQDTVFDKEQALSFEGDSGPYLQYTHARIVSVLKKAAEAGMKSGEGEVPTEPYLLERLLYQFPEVVERALTERSPHHVATFLTTLAGAFNTFYAQERIADAEDEYAGYKIRLTDAVRLTLKNGLDILGIHAPEQM